MKCYVMILQYISCLAVLEMLLMSSSLEVLESTHAFFLHIIGTISTTTQLTNQVAPIERFTRAITINTVAPKKEDHPFLDDKKLIQLQPKTAQVIPIQNFLAFLL